MVIWGIFGGVATIYGPVAAVFILYPLTEWLGSFRAFGELRLLIFAVIVLLVLLFMPRGLTPWVRDKIETQCPRCKQRNAAWKKMLPVVRRRATSRYPARSVSSAISDCPEPSAMMRPWKGVVALRHPEYLSHFLLDQQHRHPLGVDLGDRGEEFRADSRRKAERRLVDREQLRLEH